MSFAVAHRVPRTASGVPAWAGAGVDRYEADVQLAGDPSRGRVVVSHYLPFLRVHGWLQHDGRRFRWRGGPPFDPTLADVLAFLPAGTRLLLDPKEVDADRRAALTDALAGLLPADQRARFVVSTDHERDLRRYRAEGFGTWRTVKDAAALGAVLAGGALPDDGVSVRHTLVDVQVVERLHRVVPLVVAWTVNDPTRARELVALGVDGITTDRPEVAGLVR